MELGQKKESGARPEACISSTKEITKEEVIKTISITY